MTTEQVRDAILTELRSIDADERYHYPCATVFENAPLAMVQLEMETRANHCKKALLMLGYSGHEILIRPR